METISVLPFNLILTQPKKYVPTPDLLKCGSCRTEFLLSNIVDFIEHKVASACKITDSDLQSPPLPVLQQQTNSDNLTCGTCPETFTNAHSLLEHAQYTHKINIFVNSGSSKAQSSSSSIQSSSVTAMSNNLTDLPTGSSNDKSKAQQQQQQNQTNEIFIDFMPSDKRSENGSSYNITVSSSNNGNNNNEQLKINTKESSSQKTIHMSPKKKLLSYTYNSSLNSSDSDLNQKLQTPMVTSADSSVACASGQNSIKVEKNDFSGEVESKITTVTSNEAPVSSNENSDNLHMFNEIMHKSEKRKRKILNKPFYCEVCNAKFNQKIHLIKHSAKHTGIKPFKCTECSYSTVERSHLKVHIRIHTGEKPFKCTFCEYATAQSSTLKIHKKRHHNANESSGEHSKDQPSTSTTDLKNLPTHSTASSNISLNDTDDEDDHYIITNASFNDSSNDVIEVSNCSETSEIENHQHKRVKTTTVTAETEANKLLGLANIALKNEINTESDNNNTV